MAGLRIIDGTRTHIDAAAQIWAEATAARDNDPDVAPLSLSRPVIQRVLALSPDAFLLIALDVEAKAVGMAAIAPVETTPGLTELHYFGVSPSAWGRGVGRSLMTAVIDHMRGRGFAQATLGVYPDNHAAIRLYERHGWLATGVMEVRPATGKVQQEFRLNL